MGNNFDDRRIRKKFSGEVMRRIEAEYEQRVMAGYGGRELDGWQDGHTTDRLHHSKTLPLS